MAKRKAKESIQSAKVVQDKERVKPISKFGKEFRAIFLACITTIVGLSISRIIAPIVMDVWKGNADLFLFDRPYWEYGTLAYLEVKNPLILEHENYYEFKVEAPYIENFIISSFSNEKFTFSDNRSADFESTIPSKKKEVILNIITDGRGSYSFPLNFKINKIKKNNNGLSFRIYWHNNKEKSELKEVVRLLEGRGKFGMRLVFDFIEKNSVINKHIGLVSNNGIIKQNDGSFSYEITIENEDNSFDYEIYLYEVLANEKDEGRLNKINVLNLKERSHEKLAVIAAAIKRHQPDFLLFGDGPPIRGKMKDMIFEKNKLKIDFFRSINEEDLQINKQMPALILFDMAPEDITKLEESIKTNSVLGDIDVIQTITFDRLKDKMISFHSGLVYEVEKVGADRAIFSFSDSNLSMFQLEKFFEDQLLSLDGLKSHDLVFKSSRIGQLYFYFDYHTGNLEIMCCDTITGVRKENGKLKLTYEMSPEHMDNLSEGQHNAGYVITDMTFFGDWTTVHFFVGRKGYMYKRDNQIVFTIPIKVRSGQYKSADVKLFQLLNNEISVYGFSTPLDLEHANKYEWISSKDEAFNEHDKLREFFDNVNMFKVKAAIIINEKSYYGTINLLELNDDNILIKLDSGQDISQLNINQNGEFVVLFDL